MAPDELRAAIDAIAADPRKGAVIPESGGLRKLRFAVGSRGKSGGVRIIYLHIAEDAPVYLLEVFGKGEKADLTRAERNALAKVAHAIVALHRRRR